MTDTTIRDIAPDLEIRIRMVDAERDQLLEAFDIERQQLEEKYRVKFAILETEEKSYRAALEAEARRRGEQPTQKPREVPVMSLADFFIKQLGTKSPRTKDELRDAAIEAGYFQQGENPGRATHTTLLNISRSGRITDLGDGAYGPARQPVGSIFD